MSSNQLREAYRLIREGNKKQAVRMLVPMVRAEPNNADAWWLLANAVDDAEQKERALRQVLKLRPDDEAAQRMLERLEPQPTLISENADSYDAFEFDPNAEVDFDNLDDPFSDTPRRGRRRRSGGSGPLTIVLALIGLLTVLSCVACLAVSLFTAPLASQVFNDIMQTVTFEPQFATLAQIVVTVAPQNQQQQQPSPEVTPAATEDSSMPTDMQKRGGIRLGETQQAVVENLRDDSWTFSADPNEHVVIELYASASSLDPQLYLYDPQGALIAENDDIDNSNNQNSRIDIVLEEAGLYTIRVGKFSSGGAYVLTLREG